MLFKRRRKPMFAERICCPISILRLKIEKQQSNSMTVRHGQCCSHFTSWWKTCVFAMMKLRASPWWWNYPTVRFDFLDNLLSVSNYTPVSYYACFVACFSTKSLPFRLLNRLASRVFCWNTDQISSCTCCSVKWLGIDLKKCSGHTIACWRIITFDIIAFVSIKNAYKWH